MTVTVKRTDYLALVTPQAHTTIVRLAPDGKRVAFARVIGHVQELCISEAVESDPEAEDDSFWLDEKTMTRAEEEVTVLCASRDGPITDIAWSPSGSHVAFRAGGSPPGFGDQVIWARSDEPGELGRADGMAFAWSPDRPVLYVADPDEFALRRIAIDEGKSQDLAEFIHFRNPRYWPQVNACPDGRRLVFTSRHASDDTTRVWLVEPAEGRPETQLITWIPGSDVYVAPVWSTKGVSLALYVVHADVGRSGLIVLRGLRGEGQIFYEHEALDGAVAPAWAIDGRSFALFRHEPQPAGAPTPAEAAEQTEEDDPFDPQRMPTGSPGQLLGDHALVRLDLETGLHDRLCEPGELRGSVRALDDTRLLIDGGKAAHVLELTVTQEEKKE